MDKWVRFHPQNSVLFTRKYLVGGPPPARSKNTSRLQFNSELASESLGKEDASQLTKSPKNGMSSWWWPLLGMGKQRKVYYYISLHAICAGIPGPKMSGRKPAKKKGNQGCSLKNRVTPICCNKRRKSTWIHDIFSCMFHVKTRAKAIFFWRDVTSQVRFFRYVCWKTKWRTRNSSSVQMKVQFRIPECEHVMSSCWWLESWVGVRSNKSPTLKGGSKTL